MDARSRYVYAIRDDLAEEYGPLFEASSDAVALRNYKHLMSTVDEFSRNDYTLWRFGCFKQMDGGAVLICDDEPVVVQVKEINDAE